MADPYEVKRYAPRRLRLRPLVSLALAVVVLVAACWAAVTGDGAGRVLGIVASVVAGLGVVLVAAALVVGRRPVLVLEPAGLTSRGLPRVGWDEVSEMRAVGVGRQPALLVTLRDDEAFLARTSGVWRGVAEATMRASGAFIVIPAAPLGLTIEELATEIHVRQQEFGG